MDSTGGARAGRRARRDGSAVEASADGRRLRLDRRARRRPGTRRAEPLGHAPAPGRVPAAASSSPSRATSTFPPDSDDRDALAVADRDPPGQDRREGGGAGRLEDLLEPLDARSASRPGSSRRRGGRCRRGSAGTSPASRRPANGAPEAVGDAVGLDPDDLAALEGERHGVRALRLDAVDADRGAPLLDRRGHARDETAAADPDDDDVEVGQVLDELEADRAVAGDDGRIVERVDELEALGVADPLELGQRLADVRAVQDDPRAVAEAGVDLRADGPGRHRPRSPRPRPSDRPRRRPGRRCPADSVMTPRALRLGGRVAIRLVIPRALNEPVFCRCSALR